MPESQGYSVAVPTETLSKAKPSDFNKIEHRVEHLCEPTASRISYSSVFLYAFVGF